MGAENRAWSIKATNDLGKALAAIVRVPGVEPHALSVAQRQDAEAVVLELVEPVRAERRDLSWRRQARLDKADRATAML